MADTRIVIVGGGFGGLFTALNLEGSGQITLITDEDHFLFSPMLYEYLSGEVEEWHIAPKYTELVDEKVGLVQRAVRIRCSGPCRWWNDKLSRRRGR